MTTRDARRVFALVLVMWLAMSGPTALHAADAPRPNVLLIMCDDMGWSDIGCYGSEMKTPHLDGLAENGLRYTQFYNTARCWPTRSALLTGFYPQQINRDKVAGIPGGGGGRRHENERPGPAGLGLGSFQDRRSICQQRSGSGADGPEEIVPSPE